MQVVNKRKIRIERTALVLASSILVGGAWFWTLQILEVLEVLELAYG